MSTKCNGCSAVIYDILYMECAYEKCRKIYHLNCLAVSQEQFEEMTEDYKASWRCPECMRAVPKGNNADTPVRGITLNKTFTPSSCKVNTVRGNRVVLDETRMEAEDRILEEMREFRLEMKSRLEEQKKEYTLLLDRFSMVESELRVIKQSMQVVLQKANKVDLSESKVKSLLEKNECLETALSAIRSSVQSQVPKELSQVHGESKRSFINAGEIRDNQNTQVVAQKCGAMKPPGAYVEEERTLRSFANALKQTGKMQGDALNRGAAKPTGEERSQRAGDEKNGSWTVVKRKKSRYPNSEVKRGGSTQSTEIKGMEKKKILHVWRLQKDTTEENLENFIRDKIKEVPVKIEKIKHKTERDYASFIIGVPETKYDQLCQSEIWPSNTIANCNDRCLDLVLSALSADGSVKVRAVAAPLVPVDAHHPPLEIAVTLRSRQSDALLPEASPHAPIGWNFYKADFVSLYSAIAAADWTPVYAALQLEESLKLFYEILTSTIDDWVPRKKRSPVAPGYNYPEWYTVEIIRNIKLKANLHRRYKASNSRADYDAFSQCRTRVKMMIKIAHEHYRRRVQDQLLKDPLSFWSFTKSKRSSRGPQKILKNGLTLTAEQCVKEFAHYFHSVYNSEPAELNVSAAIAAAGGENGAARVHMDRLTLYEVRQALKHLKPKKSAGPDGIPPYLFKDCRFVLAEPLLHIYNQCLKEAVFPGMWKLTRVIPVPKGRSGTQLEGYRPVAVLSTAAKVLESAIHKIIYNQVSAQLSDAQLGFRPGRSTTSNLLSYMSVIGPTIDNGGQTDAAYFDFSKAFDLVDNDVLLKKLAAVGFTPHLLNFFASYLKDRQQYVEYRGHRSEPYYTRSGVSQGSNLGPLQFILMINDLPQVIQDCKCWLFADDLKLSRTVDDGNDCTRMQQDIDRVVKW
ncbi:jg24388, partial [Pararge aegeria aegeria]